MVVDVDVNGFIFVMIGRWKPYSFGILFRMGPWLVYISVCLIDGNPV